MANVGNLLENSALSSTTGGLSTLYNLVGSFAMGHETPVIDPYAGSLNQQIAGEYTKDRIDKRYGVNTATNQQQLLKALGSDPTYVRLEEQLAQSEIPYMGTSNTDDSSWYSYATNQGISTKNPRTFLSDMGISPNTPVSVNTKGLPFAGGAPQTSNPTGGGGNSSAGSILAAGGLGALLSYFSSGNSGGGGSMATSSGGVNLSNIFATPGTSGTTESTGQPGTFSSIASLLQGGAGLYEANQLNQGTQAAANVSNPFGPYRQQYALQLNQLMSDPTSLKNYPGYQAGIQAVQRGAASTGLLGSGKEAVDLMQYGGNMYNQAVAQLAELAGAGINPGIAGQLMQQGGVNQANLTGQALNSLTYGAQSYLNNLGTGTTTDSGLLPSLGNYGTTGIPSGDLGTGFSMTGFTPDTGGVSGDLGSGFFNAGSSGFDFSSFGY